LLSDQQIIALVRKGKVEAFGHLVARHQKPVFRLAWSMLGNWNDAEDASQEVFIRAYEKLSTFREEGTLWGWLRRITVNICLGKARPLILTSFEEMDDIQDDLRDPVCDLVMQNEEAAGIRRLIHELPIAYRSVIVLRYLEDMSYAEIADTLGEPLTNVQVRLHRAKKMLRETLSKCRR
jgi:RNA polymerase sigma-70 factor, ECF subfamily